MLDVAEIRAVDVFHHVGGAVGDRHGKDGLAGGQLDLERHADVEGAAQFGGDALPGEAGAAAVGSEFEVRELLLFAEDVVVAAAGQGHEQPEGEAQLRAVQELPGAVGGGEVDEGAGVAVEFQAQGVIGEDDGSHGEVPTVTRCKSPGAGGLRWPA